MGFEDATVPDLTGKLAVVTGASDGIGFALAGRLARAGAELVLPVRNRDKGEAAATRIRDLAPGIEVSTRPLDLASLESVRQFATALNDEGRPIDYLIANAGVMMPATRHLTVDGFELQMGTNHLGHMALVGMILPLLSRAGGRVTTMSSAAARTGKIDWRNLQGEIAYSATASYMTSKLAQMLFALELDRRSKANGWNVTSNVAHPGTTYTRLYSVGPNMGRGKPSPYDGLMRRLSKVGLFVQTVDKGLLPALYAATSPRAAGGRFYGPDGIGHFTGSAIEQAVYKVALDEAMAGRLWETSEQLTGVHFPTTAPAERE